MNAERRHLERRAPEPIDEVYWATLMDVIQEDKNEGRFAALIVHIDMLRTLILPYALRMDGAA